MLRYSDSSIFAKIITSTQRTIPGEQRGKNTILDGHNLQDSSENLRKTSKTQSFFNRIALFDTEMIALQDPEKLRELKDLYCASKTRDSHDVHRMTLPLLRFLLLDQSMCLITVFTTNDGNLLPTSDYSARTIDEFNHFLERDTNRIH